jgi:RND family efflux transporter MFP subunit
MPKKLFWIITPVLLIMGLFMWYLVGHHTAESSAQDSTDLQGSAAPAAVARVERQNLASTLDLSGEFKPFQEVDIHAKVAGYVQHIYVDVGDHVKQGQTVAILEIPELAAQLAGAEASMRAAQEQIHRAESDLQRAQSTHSAMHSAYMRLKQAGDSRAGLVAQQEVDDSQARDLAAEAQVQSAEAELSTAKRKLEVAQANQRQFAALSDYARITAPFAGVITNRYADQGALIQAGTASNTQAMPVVRLAQISTLRLVLPIPESVAALIHLGDPVKVRIQALNQNIAGKVSRFADSLDRQTRTMETEIDFDNRDGRLIPGMYAESQIFLHERKDVLTVPLQAVTRNGNVATVLAVNSQNVIEERHVSLGMEDSSNVEVLSGLNEEDRVVLGNRSEFHVGQKVQPKLVDRPKANGEK